MVEPSSTLPQTTRSARFAPAVFLETAANGRVISKHKKKQIIFAQGDTADSVFYIKAVMRQLKKLRQENASLRRRLLMQTD
jgi:hypothetical protein